MMNFFDIFVLIVVIGLGIAGFREGFFRSMVKLAGFLLVAALLAILSDEICAVCRRIHVIPVSVAIPLAFILLFVGGMIAVAVAAKAVHAIVHLTPVGFLDSGFGAAFGILKALLVGGLAAIVLMQTPEETLFRKQVDSSSAGRPLAGLVSGIVPFVRSAVQSYRQTAPEHEPEKDNGETIDKDSLI